MTKILIEFYYHKIRVVAAEQGLLEEAGTKRNTANRLDDLRMWTVFRGRLREARYLTYFRIDLVNNNAEDLEVLQEFLRAISETNHVFEEAQTRLDLARCMIRSRDLQYRDEAQDQILKAERIFNEEGHVFGLLDLQDMQLSEKKDSISLKDILGWKLQCAEAYLERACYQQGIRCLIFAIPVNHDMGEIFQQTQSILERAQAEIVRVGGVFLEQALFINAVAQALVRAPEYGYARKSLEDYLDRLPSEISPKALGGLYVCLRGAYTNVGNFDKALFYADQALVTSLEGASYTDTSDAAFARAVTRMDRGRGFPRKSIIAQIWLATSITFLRGWTEVDRIMCYHQQEVEKYALLANAENEMGHFFNDEQAFIRSDQWLEAAHKSSETYDVSSSRLRELDIARAARLQNFDMAVQIAHDHIRILQEATHTTPFVLAQATIIASATIHQRYFHRLQAATHMTGGNYGSITQDLIDALKLALKAFDLCGAAGGSETIVTALNWVYELVLYFPSANRRDLMKTYLTEAEKIEVFCDAIRRSSSTTRDVSSLFEKRGIVSTNEYRKLYANAIEACLDLEDAPAAWVWIQKSKARALSDVFGIRALIPDALLQAIATDGEAQMLYEKERLSIEYALKAGPLDYISARRKTESDRTEIRKHPLLGMVLDIREGTFNVDFQESELNEAIKLCNVSREAIKYVDWFISTTNGSDNKVILLVRGLDGVTRSKMLDITITTVEAWIRRVFEFPDEAEPPLRREDARRNLRELAPLVQGLEQLTNEEDLLILSPCGPLNRVPIHALPVGKHALIERNPVIYSSSAAIFRQCHMRAAAQASKYDNRTQRAAFLAVYESSTIEGQRERSKIYEHADKVSISNFPFEVRKGTAVTKASFREAARVSPWVHYHGHALFDKMDVLRSCLVLSDRIDQTQAISPIASGLDPKHLTVEDIFSIDMLDNAPHFTVIACDSGTQDIATGDEPLGIIPALLYAGATSALGTLWPVDSHAARSFTDIFYDNLRQQMEAQCTQEPTLPQFLVLDIAAALRKTVRKMMDRNRQETKAPLHWAAYVLHGAWFHILPLACMTREQAR
jgi:CHAT domain-containing protein/tetratricopeptide (TPR) repeat protein